MNTKAILAASFAALAITAGAPGVAAMPMQNHSGGAGMQMQDKSEGMNPPMMRGTESPREMGGGMMAGSAGNGGMMAGGAGNAGMMGMMGMMGSCLTAVDGGLDHKTAMRMRGEMMRAIGDILIKYADQVQEPAAKQ